MSIAGEKASSLPIQVIGDAAFPTVPASCSSSGPPENTVPTFGANGLLGVGLFLQDCGAGCAQSAIPGTYYSCPSSGCRATQVALNKQLQNPVALFSADNNGVIIQLPAVPAAGAATANGSLIFGIGTQADNGLGGAVVLTVDPNTGYIGTTFGGLILPHSYIDSGSSVLFFGTGTYPLCIGDGSRPLLPPLRHKILPQRCRVSTKLRARSAFSVANADQLFKANPASMRSTISRRQIRTRRVLPGALPFFFGRSVYTAIETRSTPGGYGAVFRVLA